MHRSLIVIAVLGLQLGTAEGRGLQDFVVAARPATGVQHYLGGVRLAAPIATIARRLPWIGQRVQARSLVQVTNATLETYVQQTERGYLEVVVPANKGHVFFRHGREVFDFYPGGFRVGTVRPIGSERYGMLIPLTPKQERKLEAYLGRLKRTEGKELGAYDFEGDKGFHCVSWMTRCALDRRQRSGVNIVDLLGGKPGDGESMPRFARFLLQRARPLDAVVVYQDTPRTDRELDTLRPAIMSLRDLRRAHTEENGR
jgi:hypothetical protein